MLWLFLQRKPHQPLLGKGKQLIAIALANHAADNLGVDVEVVVHQGITQTDDLAPADQPLGRLGPPLNQDLERLIGILWAMAR